MAAFNRPRPANAPAAGMSVHNQTTNSHPLTNVGRLHVVATSNVRHILVLGAHTSVLLPTPPKSALVSPNHTPKHSTDTSPPSHHFRKVLEAQQVCRACGEKYGHIHQRRVHATILAGVHGRGGGNVVLCGILALRATDAAHGSHAVTKQAHARRPVDGSQRWVHAWVLARRLDGSKLVGVEAREAELKGAGLGGDDDKTLGGDLREQL